MMAGMSWGSTIAWVKYGGLVGKDGWRYTFSPRDARWTIAALYGESESSGVGPWGDAVLWTWAQRMYLYRNNREMHRRDGYLLPWPHTYADIILSHSSPVNPYWRHRGDEWAINRRANIVSMEPEDFPRGFVEWVLSWLRGERAMDPRFAGLVDFSRCDCVGCGEDDHGPADLHAPGYPRSNCFWKEAGTRSWTTETLRPVQASRGSSVVLPLALGVTAVSSYLVLSGKILSR
jgi:hypothetical protein